MRLSQNHVTGVIPEEFKRFSSLSLSLAGNHILGIPPPLCGISEWNDGDVRDFGCEGILCKPGSFNAYGRKTSGVDCFECSGAVYYGERQCETSGVSRLSFSFILCLQFGFFLTFALY
mmetsp:Transcript_19737/g.35575  ORF Transcript_19737/g.35575 Transcript_19737/m.35575 type:complete len:118 (+) Transcript_19737:599-952(+)